MCLASLLIASFTLALVAVFADSLTGPPLLRNQDASTVRGASTPRHPVRAHLCIDFAAASPSSHSTQTKFTTTCKLPRSLAPFHAPPTPPAPLWERNQYICASTFDLQVVAVVNSRRMAPCPCPRPLRTRAHCSRSPL
ncbi:hypothetical protein B0H16DRAFT_1733860 [Mycena metata]|uniref:Secreted protein n=1 Tax=Mycena metata TaxID=1033252 RepID=A0AAD7MS66_9AGAR|nr:hypothetical protein B0H16DRAFT_1733860 [Mycena metata]